MSFSLHNKQWRAFPQLSNTQRKKNKQGLMNDERLQTHIQNEWQANSQTGKQTIRHTGRHSWIEKLID